ncbi:ADP-L-glycero-D-manno-heptose-6-epimerase [Methanimicrococcus stummii]|uniref:ADP-L-glycero-D-manno-heptose-6-epimerase n=1 Tax=Methanimicrococcus stummii TaxID=3028294 RepID=A0AA96VBQ2_9EURY|nr:SDR family NAD(P)-dependent oxidoreductase [Methanimicrococcus sp. Es2]WNY29260.1 ADP-L-glycero-D-manno-heptose-6-epimerase [Methanimicrococcus sp. Es2]
MKALITGGAGFIGSHLCDILIQRGWNVLAVDNLSSGHKKNIAHLFENSSFEFKTYDVTDEEQINEVMNGIDMVYHLAAHPDIRAGNKDPSIDYKDTLLTTKNVLEAMRKNNVKKMFFASTSAVYGNMPETLLSETTGGLEPISYYGACKLASESLISAYAYMNDMNILIFRFPNVVGPRLTHGVIFDFIKKLKENNKELTILGDGKQKKQYIYIDDLINGIIMQSEKMNGRMSLYNISTESFATVTEIADLVCQQMKLENVDYKFTGGKTGWKGDVPTFQYDIRKIKSTGWVYEYTSLEAIQKTLTKIEI